MRNGLQTLLKGIIYTLVFAWFSTGTATAQSWTMVQNDTVFINACSTTGGIIYDDGGPDGNYSNAFAGWVVIEASEGVSISLAGEYNLEGCCDYITVWDGTPGSGTQLWYNCGNGTLNLTATSGRMTLQFTSDYSVVRGGFAFTWSRDGWGTNACTSGITEFTATSVTSTTANLSWAASATSLYLDYGQGEQLMSPAGNGTTLTGLNPNTVYTVRLYGEGELSNPCCVAQTSFRTECGLMAAPMVERFDDLLVDSLPPCWNMGKNFDDESLFPRVTTAAAKSGTKSLMLSSGQNTVAGHWGMAIGPKMATDISNLKVHLSLRTNIANAKLEIGVCDTTSGFYSYYGFVPVDTLTVSQSGQWYDFTVPMTAYTGGGCRLAFRMMQGLQPAGNCIIYIDDIMAENCGVDSIRVLNAGARELTLSWSIIGNPTVDLTVSGGSGSTTYSSVTSPYTVTSLEPDTRYTLTLMPRCGGVHGAAKSTSFTTLSGDTIALQYCQDFESGWPADWYRPEMYNGFPQHANSGGYCMQMYHYYDSENTAVLPLLSVAPGEVGITLRMKPQASGSGIVVGVMDYPHEMNSFTPVDTLVNPGTDYRFFSVDLSTYSGSGRYLALRTYSPTSSNQYIYVDDISVGRCLVSGLRVSGTTHNSITLEWDFGGTESENYDSVVIEYGAPNFALGSGTRLAILPAADCTPNDGSLAYTVAGLDSATSYQFAVYRLCGDDACNPPRVNAGTQMRRYTVPFCENFDGVSGDNYVYFPDWSRTSMFDGRPCLWQYGDDIPSPTRALDFHSYGPLEYGRQHSTAILPHLDWSGNISDLVVSFYSWFNSDNYTAFLEVGVITDPNDESTFTPVDTVFPPYRTPAHFAVPLGAYNGEDGHIAFRYYHSCNYCYYTAGLDNLEVRTSGIGKSDIYSLRTDGATLEWETVGQVGSVALRLIHGSDTTVVPNVTSPYSIAGLAAGETYRYELDYGQCFPIGGTFTTRSEAVGADWCYGFETGYNNGRYDGWTYPLAYSTGNGTPSRGSYALSLGSYNINSTATILPYLEETDYTGLSLTFQARHTGYCTLVVGLVDDPRDTAGMVPLLTVNDNDNVYRNYEINLTGHESDGHHIVFWSYNHQNSGCYGCSSYSDIDQLRIDRGNRILTRSHTSTSTTADILWSATDATDSVRVILSDNDGNTVFDSTAAAVVGSCHIADLAPGTAYTLHLEALSTLSSGGCDPDAIQLRTLDHDFAAGYCENCGDSFSILPDGWTWLAQNGQQPSRSDQSSRYQRQTIALRSQSPADAYTMIVSPEAVVPLQGLVLGCSAWYDTEEGVQASWLVAGVIADPTDASTFVALDTLRLSHYMQQFAIDLSAYTGNARHIAFKAMSIDGYDRTAYITDIGLADWIADGLHTRELTPTSAILRWTGVGSTDSIGIRIIGGTSIIDTVVGTDSLTLAGLQPGTAYTATMPVSFTGEVGFQPITNYSNLSLSNFTQLQQNGTVNFSDGYTKRFLVHGVRRILVTAVTGTDQYCVLSIDPNDQENDPNNFSITDMFSFCRTDIGWEHSFSNPLYDNTTVGQTSHIYTSRTGNGTTVSVTYSNLGWVLEFSSPVCITYGQQNILHENIYYQCGAGNANLGTVCQRRSVSFTTPVEPLASPLCMPLDDIQYSATVANSHHLPSGWTRPYGNRYPCGSSDSHDGGTSIQFQASECNSSSDMNSMAVSPYIESDLAGLHLDLWVKNNNTGTRFIVGTVADPADHASFVAHDTLGTYPYWSLASLDLSAYHGHFLALLFEADDCNWGSGYIEGISLTPCPMPRAWLSNQEDTSVNVNFTGTSPVWVEYAFGGEFAPGSGTLLPAESSPLHIGGLNSASTYTFHVWPRCSADTFVCNYVTLIQTTMHPPVATPYCHNFEAIGHNGYPEEWSRWNPDGTTCAVTADAGHGDSRSLHLHSFSPESVVAIMPKVEPASLCTDSLFLNFWSLDRGSQQATLEVGVVTDLGDTASFLPFDTITLAGDWQHFTSALPRAALLAGRAAFRLPPWGNVVVDNLCLESCVAANVEVSEITQHTATITWDGYGVDTLLVEYGRSGFAQGTGTVVAVTTSPYTITGLSASSDYNFIFRTICSCPSSCGSVYPAGGGTGGATWWDGVCTLPYAWIDTTLYPGYRGWGVGYGWGSGGGVGRGGGLSVGTETQAEMLVTPYCEDFDTTEAASVPAGWRRIGGSTPGYPQTVRTPVLSGARSIDLYATTGYSNHLALPPVANPSGLILAFSAYNTNSEAQYRPYGVLTVGVMDDPDRGSTFTAVDTVVLGTTGRWSRHFVDLSAYSGNGQYIAFRFVPKYNSYHLYLDNIYLGSCAVTSATTDGAVLDYTIIGAATGVLVEDTGGYLAALTSPQQPLPGLNPQAHYELTVRAFSDSDTQSLCHLAPIAINPVLALPYCENFDAVGGTLPSGWTVKHSYQSNYPQTTDGHLVCGPYNNTSYGYDILLLPPLAAGDTIGGKFVGLLYEVPDGDSYNYTRSWLDVGYLTDTSNWNTFVTLATLQNSQYSQYHSLQLPASAATRLALRARSTSSTRWLYIDNLTVSATPLPTAGDIDAPETGYASKTLHWNANPLASHYQYEWGPAGYTPGTGTLAVSDSCSLTLQNLAPSTDYDIYFVSSDGRYACSPYRFTTVTPAALPLCDEFNTYGSCGNCRPDGWAWSLSNNTEFYCTSGNNWSLYFYSSYYNNDYIYTSLPELDIDSMHNLSMHLRYLYDNSEGMAEIGVVNAWGDWSSFTPVDTLPCNLNNWSEHLVSFAHYGGSGRFVAIRFRGYQYQYNYLYIDRLDLQNAPIPALSALSSRAILAEVDSAIADPDYWIDVCAAGSTQGTVLLMHATSHHFTIDSLRYLHTP